MNIMISLGQGSTRLISSAKQAIDNVDCLYFENVDSFTHQCTLRHLFFDRLIFSQRFISTEEDMKKLCDYVRSNMDSVEIIYVSNATEDAPLSSQEELFLKYFDSPMYTVMRITTGTAKMIIEAVSIPIEDVKARYFSVDFNSKKVKKRNRRKLPVNFEKQKISQEISLTAEKATESKENKPEEVSPEIVSDVSENSYSEGQEEESSDSDDFNNLGFDEMELYSVGDENSKSEFSGVENDDFDLTIGDYGVQHSDSGFVGDDELEELEALKGSKLSEDAKVASSATSSVKSTPVDIIQEDEEDIVDFLERDILEKKRMDEKGRVDSSISMEKSIEMESEKVKFSSEEGYVNSSSSSEDTGSSFSQELKRNIERKPSVNTQSTPKSSRKSVIDDGLVVSNKVNIITGLNGSGVTAFIVAEAVKFSEQGLKVLILDLDYKTNGILSFIDTGKFYATGGNKGIEDKRIYNEDGIDIISNGYGEGIHSDVNGMLGTSVLKRYNIVLVDCPLDCLHLLRDDVFCKCNVVIGVISDISKLIETSSALFNREFVSMLKEVYISKQCRVANKNIARESLEELKQIVFFPNGCWLENI